MLVSIIIPAYNAEATLRQCLEACLRQTHAATEVIVVDDGSRDGCAEIVGSFEGVTYVVQENAGPAVARNRGARVARGEVIAFTDSDCVAADAWIEELLTGFSEGVVAVGGTYGIANGERMLARLVHYEIVGRHAAFGEEVDFLGSFNVAYRKAAFDAMGGFDEGFLVASGEDNDLSYRLQDAGGTLRFVRGAVVAHYHPVALWRYLWVQGRHGYWRMKVYAKHPGRARTGDRYAGFFELAGIPLSLLVLVLLPTLLSIGIVTGHTLFYAGCYAVLLILYYGWHLPLAGKLLGGRPLVERVLFAGLVSLRDVSRALGMLKGMMTFSASKEGVR